MRRGLLARVLALLRHRKEGERRRARTLHVRDARAEGGERAQHAAERAQGLALVALASSALASSALASAPASTRPLASAAGAACAAIDLCPTQVVLYLGVHCRLRPTACRGCGNLLQQVGVQRGTRSHSLRGAGKLQPDARAFRVWHATQQRRMDAIFIDVRESCEKLRPLVVERLWCPLAPAVEVALGSAARVGH